jgi:hypothetical protein
MFRLFGGHQVIAVLLDKSIELQPYAYVTFKGSFSYSNLSCTTYLDY